MRFSLRHLPICLIILTVISCSVFSPETSASATLPAPVDFFEGVPIIPGAVGAHAIGTWYEYQIDATVLEVQEYYLREMPAAGWELWYQTGDANEGETSIRLNYRKGEEQTAIFINPAEGGLVHVLIS